MTRAPVFSIRYCTAVFTAACVAASVSACSSDDGPEPLTRQEALRLCQNKVEPRYQHNYQSLKLEVAGAVEEDDVWRVAGTVQGVNTIQPKPGEVATATESSAGLPKMRFECEATIEETTLTRWDFGR